MLVSTCTLYQFCFSLFWAGSPGIFGSALSCSWFGAIFITLTSYPFWNAWFAKYRSWLIKPANTFLTLNQLTSFVVDIKDGPFNRTDFCGVVNTFSDSFFSYSFFPIEFHPFSFFSSLSCLMLFWKSSVSFIVIVVIFNTEVVSFYFSLMPTFGILFDYWILCLTLVQFLRCSSWLNVSDIFILVTLRFHSFHSLRFEFP